MIRISTISGVALLSCLGFGLGGCAGAKQAPGGTGAIAGGGTRSI